MSIRLNVVGAVCLGSICATSVAQVRISEIYFDSPGNDLPNEYIELRGTPNFSLDEHYIVILENEIGSAGSIDNVFDLNGRTIGTNGHLLLRMREAQHTGIAPGTRDLVNTGEVFGFGHGADSTIGHYKQFSASPLEPRDIENGGFSAFLVHIPGGMTTTARPSINDWMQFDLDAGNDGLDTNVDYSAPGPHYLYDNNDGDGRQWRILDSIGQNEPGETSVTVRSYAQVQFSATNITTIQPGAVNVAVHNFFDEGLEVEHLFRWGSSDGDSPEDWAMANLTDNSNSGFSTSNRWSDGFRASGLHTGNPYGEVWHGFIEDAAAYGATIQKNLGRPNWPVPDGDLSQNLKIDQADLSIVVNNWHVNDPSTLGHWLSGDPSGDGFVGPEDLDFVMDRWPLFGTEDFTTPDFGILTADTNLDGIVDVADLGVLATNWQTNVLGYKFGDFNYDGIVDVADLGTLASRWQTGFGVSSLPEALAAVGLPVTSVPEPSALGLLLASGLAIRRRAGLRTQSIAQRGKHK